MAVFCETQLASRSSMRLSSRRQPSQETGESGEELPERFEDRLEYDDQNITPRQDASERPQSRLSESHRTSILPKPSTFHTLLCAAE